MKSFILTIWIFVYFVSAASIGFTLDESSKNAPLNALRDVKGPVNFPTNYVLLTIIVLLLLVIGGVFTARFLRKKQIEEEEIPEDTRAAWEIAYEQFEQLEKSSLLEEGKFKQYYSQLSAIIRTYFENQFQVRAPEMTTEEFLWSLEETQDLTVNQNTALKKFMKSCDIVKFAKYIPGVEEGRASFKFARELVNEIKAVDDQAEQPDNNQKST